MKKKKNSTMQVEIVYNLLKKKNMGDSLWLTMRGMKI